MNSTSQAVKRQVTGRANPHQWKSIPVPVRRLISSTNSGFIRRAAEIAGVHQSMASKVWLDVATSRRVADAIMQAISLDKELRRMITAEVRKAAQQAA